MIIYTYNQYTGDHSFEPAFSLADFERLIGRVFGAKDPYLDYSVGAAAENYDDGSIDWIRVSTEQGGLMPLPYHLVHDYRHRRVDSWGRATITGEYSFPAELTDHRDAMIMRMLKEKRIKRDEEGRPKDSRCPRVIGCLVERGDPTLNIEVANYLSQVGTNLSLDHPLPRSMNVRGTDCKTAREWDKVQAGVTGRGLPDWNRSRLANTIGVGVGLSAVSKSGVRHFVYRYRTKDAPVFPNTWHLPVSFALEIDESIQVGQVHDIKDLILKDLPEELYAEAKLHRRDFHALQPLAFCRELSRGGKPQFFCHLESKVPLETLLTRIGESSEYLKAPRALPAGTQLTIPTSPELACYLALMMPG